MLLHTVDGVLSWLATDTSVQKPFEWEVSGIRESSSTYHGPQFRCLRCLRYCTCRTLDFQKEVVRCRLLGQVAIKWIISLSWICKPLQCCITNHQGPLSLSSLWDMYIEWLGLRQGEFTSLAELKVGGTFICVRWQVTTWSHILMEISPDEASPEDWICLRVRWHQLPIYRLISNACLSHMAGDAP